MDIDGDGCLDFDEFLMLMAKHQAETADTEEELKEGFAAFDKDNDRFITKDDLQKLFESFGEKLTDEELDNMIRVADRSKCGKVSFEDFQHVLNGTR